MHMASRWPIGMGVAGLAGGLATLLLEWGLGGDFGYPGSLAYARYETYNRLMALCLAVCAFSFVGAYRVQTPRPRRRLALIMAGFGLMVIGNVAEFWLFTDVPYGALNSRAYAWLTFLFGLLLVVIACVSDLVAELRTPGWVRGRAWLAGGYSVLQILSVFAGGSIFGVIGLGTVVLGGWLLMYPARQIQAV